MCFKLFFTFVAIFGITVTGYPQDPSGKDDKKMLTDFKTKELPDRTVCGLEARPSRIIGGTIADIDEFPWTVGLEFQRKISPFDNVGVICGGTLINNRYVLTAAHCIIQKEFQLVAVRLGEWNTTSDPDCPDFGTINENCTNPVKRLTISKQIPHPFYSKRNYNNDVGLLRLSEDIAYTDYIRPICLPPIDLPPPALGSRCTVAGWGLTGCEKLSEIKLKSEVPFVPGEECNRRLDEEVVSPNRLCAGGVAGSNSFQGDPGGPLMRIYEDRAHQQSQWYLEGVVSGDLSCALEGIPVVYSRVSRYMNWIIREISEIKE